MSLEKLMQIPGDQRDENWEDQFLTGLTEGRIEVLSPEPQVGPDGWPYLMVQTSTNEKAEPAQKVLQWLSERGVGLAVNPHKDYPDYILTWGMVWSFRETGRFIRRDLTSEAGAVELNMQTIAHAGTPTPQYLPNYVRSILREFFRDQGVIAPKILVLSQDRVNYELAFSLESLGNPPASEHAGVAEAISWFLPPHYPVILVSEKGLPQFGPL